MRMVAALVVTLVVAGCATQAERAAAVARDVDDMIAVYGPGCEKLGYTSGTDPWRECVLRLATSDRLERRDLMTTHCFGSYGFLHCNSF
jgi:hypothetical protein